MSTLRELGPADAIAPGEHAVYDLGNRQIGVFNIGGTYYALPNTCFHQNGPLCRGLVRGTVMADEASGFRREWRRIGAASRNVQDQSLRRLARTNTASICRYRFGL